MRDPTIMLWPDALAPVNMSATIDRPAFKGPKPLDGREQVVFSTAGGWQIAYEGVPVYGDKFRLYKSIWTQIGGFSRPIYVKPEFSPNMLARRNNISALTTTFSGGALFSHSVKLPLDSIAAWEAYGTSTVTAAADTAPDGTTTALTLADADTVNPSSRYRYLLNMPTDKADYRLVVYVKKPAVAPTYIPAFSIVYNTGTEIIKWARLAVNHFTGTVTSFEATIKNVSVDLISGFYRVSFDTPNINCPLVGVVLEAAFSAASDPVNIVQSATGSIVVWSPELYRIDPTTARFSQSTADCILAANAKRGDVTLTVTNSTVSPVAAGDYFEIDGRLHLVRAIDGASWKIWPSLRKNAASGTVLEIDDPRLLAYLVTDSNALTLNQQFGRVSRVNVDFIEANW